MKDATEQYRKRPSGAVLRSAWPLNAETLPGVLREGFVTPAETFYVRNHGTIPPVDSRTYRLRISGLVERPLELSLQDLRRKFPKTVEQVTLNCAGNRRDGLAEVAPIPGEIVWGPGAVGNAEWGGVPLAAVLEAAGVRSGAGHVAFEGLDEPEEAESFGGSVPLRRAFDSGALLAYEMNGEPLPAEHGFPVRAVIGGYIGARSVKWLRCVTLQESPSENHYQRSSYRLFPPYAKDEPAAEKAGGPALGETSVNSIICAPSRGETVPAGAVSVQGLALTGGGRLIERVDLSTDAGKTWTPTRLSEASEDLSRWTWRFWEAELRLEPGRHKIVCRAVDSAADSQPESAAAIWNVKGYVNNAWHSVTVDAR